MKETLIIVDEKYRVYKAFKFTPKMVKDVQDGKISVFNTFTMQGINLDLTWSNINEWDNTLSF